MMSSDFTKDQNISIKRATKETEVQLQVNFTNSANDIEINTGVGFFDHMLNQLAFYAGWSLNLQAKGDIEVDEHHLIEDVAICLGQAIAQYRQQTNIERFGQRLLPMDETLVMVAADVCGRGCAVIRLGFTREMMGGIGTEMWPHFFKTLAYQAGISLHINEQYSDNNHHLIEAAFKGLGMTLKQALQPIEQLKSTKGVLEP
jgi:imidazoleglycerol-phosphate dehydratase